MTLEEKFLAWCKEHNVQFETRPSGDGLCYNINPGGGKAHLVVQGVKLELNPMQECSKIEVYFRCDGSWAGGTNMIWNTDLPWHDSGHRTSLK